MSHFVFVHGGMVGGNCWKKVCQILEEKNHKVFAPTLTGLGEKKHLSNPDVDLEVHIQDILNTIFYEELEDIYLIGHSYGGMVITGVADRIPKNIKKLVYIAAVLPKNGESMFDAVGPEISSFLYKNAKLGNGWQVPASTPQSYGIKTPEDINWFNTMTSPHPLKSFQQKLSIKSSSFHDIDKVYIKCSQDQALEPMARRAETLKIPCYELNSGHFPMLTDVEGLVDLVTNM